MDYSVSFSGICNDKRCKSSGVERNAIVNNGKFHRFDEPRGCKKHPAGKNDATDDGDDDESRMFAEEAEAALRNKVDWRRAINDARS
ncbi:hypothetical protein T4D_1809 [Trichinella pseudospiralis]|uniref:Uncharacterized protein n=1 Tax=Trichinella pseudospiralis TaxID=6337 RepID=A0A0V1FKU6_TRIPS|nr:hypothetical protein T4D_1809 [Trichinella pseudospiralis]